MSRPFLQPALPSCSAPVTSCSTLFLSLAAPARFFPFLAAPHQPVTFAEGFAAVISILLGLVLTFFGYHFLQMSLAFAAVYFTFTIFYSILTGAGVTDEAVVYWTSMGVAMVAGVLVACFYKLGLFILGCVGGGSLAVWMLSWSEEPFIASVGWRWCFIIVLALIVGILALIFVKYVAMVVTAWIGAFFTFLGIDTFAQTGFSQSVGQILTGDPPPIDQYSAGCYGMLAGCIALAIIGMLVQFFVTGRGDQHSKLDKSKNKKGGADGKKAAAAGAAATAGSGSGSGVGTAAGTGTGSETATGSETDTKGLKSPV